MDVGALQHALVGLAGEDKHGLRAGILRHSDIGVQAVADHDALARVDAHLAG